MAQINNREVLKRIERDTFVKGTNDRQLSDNVIPVLVSNPDPKLSSIVLYKSLLSTGAGAVYSVPAGKSLYITSAMLSMNDDAASDNTATSIVCVFNGTATSILSIMKPTLTAYYDSKTISYPVPIKIDEGTSITLQNTFTVGNSAKKCTITGFLVDND